MKVIVQNIAARKFLGADGQWVASQAEAQDFYTLLRAYHFAEANTAVRFRVLLHSPDDNYSASIIEGVGLAEDAIMGFRAPAQKAPFTHADRWTNAAVKLNQNFNATRLHLN